MDVEASCFKDTPQVLTGAVDRHIANEYFGRLPEQDCKGKAFCVEGGFFKDSRDGEFDFEPLPLVRQPSELPHS